MKPLKLGLVVMFILALSWPLMGQAAWTTVGSTGTVDEADLSIFYIDNELPQMMQFKGITSGTLNIRYNVMDASLQEGGPGVYLGMHYWDTGLVGARVILRLKQYSYSTGVTKTVSKLDSDDFDPPGYAYNPGLKSAHVIWNCYGEIMPIEGFFNFDFSQNAYFIDAEITRIGPISFGQQSKAGLAMIKIEMIPCP